MKRRRKSIWRWLIVGVLALTLVAGGFYVYKSQTTLAQSTEETPVQTATVRRGDLVVSATGAGAVIPEAEVSIGFASGGLLTEVPVEVGDDVEAGEVLARVDDTSARSQIASAELNLKQAQLQLDQLLEEPTAAELAAAQANLASAKATLESRQNPATSAEIAAAQQNALSAQQKLSDLLAGPTAEELATAQADLQLAEISLQQAQAAYDPVSWRSDIGSLPQGIALQEATLAYEKAKASYATATSGASQAEISSARAAVSSAQATLNSLKEGATAQELAAAQASVDQAQAQLDALLAGSDAVDVQLAQIAVETAENALATAREALDETVLTAPFAGTILAVDASVGERVGGTAFITLADLAQPLVEIYLDETDLDKVGVDYEAEVTFDALPDQSFTGHVIRVDPQLTTSNGATVVRALVQLDADSFAKPQGLPIGLNAAVEVISGRAEQALLVPVEALREISDGQYAVFVMVNGEPELRMVEVGLMDYTYAEITSGLAAGDVVTTGIVTTNDNAARSSTSSTTQSASGPPADMMIMGAPPSGQ
jgi:multidrug efflux pump subunit AcrA (membrane-fusion protein)